MKNILCKYISINLVLAFTGCTLYEMNDKLLASYIRGDGTKVNIYYVDLGATTKQVIQVRTAKPPLGEVVIKNFESNFLQSSNLISDSSLLLVLSDSGSLKKDTIYLSIKK